VSTARHVDQMLEIYTEVATQADPANKTSSGRIRIADRPLLRAGDPVRE
jgi:hypothetical protein